MMEDKPAQLSEPSQEIVLQNSSEAPLDYNAYGTQTRPDQLLDKGSLTAVNEQFSEGQQTTSNNVIVMHRYSKQSTPQVLDSTVRFRASSTAFGLVNESRDDPRFSTKN